MESCAIFPKVVNKEGKKVPSKLFKDLLGVSPDRNTAVDLWEKTKQTEFINHPDYQNLEIDELGEPTIESLIAQAGFNKYIDDTQIVNKLNKDNDFVDKDGSVKTLPNTNDNYRELLHKCNSWNKASKFGKRFIASIKQTVDTLSAKIEVIKASTFDVLSAKMQYEETLNDKLIKTLNSWGIGIGSLNEAEERLRLNGVTDFDSAKKTAEGFIELIRIAKGERGQQALPEEFAHAALEALRGNPLVDRLLNLIIDKELDAEILGDEYEEYRILYKDDKVKLAKEAAGKLFAKHLLQNQEIPNAGYKTLLKRLIDYFKQVFSKFNGDEIQRAITDANEGFAELSKQLLSGELDHTANLDNLKEVSGQLYQIEERVVRQKKLLSKILDNETKRLQIYQKRHSRTSTFVASEESLIADINFNLLFGKHLVGVSSFLESASSTLRGLIARLNQINSGELSVQEKASILRDIKNYIDSYKPLMGAIAQEEDRMSREEDITDEERQVMEALIQNLYTAQGLVNKVESRYQDTAKELFISFIEPFIGTNIKFKYGEKAGQNMTAEELLESAEEDVGVYSRWLASMADSPDAFLRIIDSATKTSKQRARLKTIEYNKRIQEIIAKLDRAGIKGFSWMFKVNENGEKTGKYIQPVDEEKYNKDRLAYQEEQLTLRRKGEITVEQQAQNVAEWIHAHTIIDENGVRKPDPMQYQDAQFAKLNAAQKEAYEAFMQIKKELEAMLETPEDLYNIVNIRKDLIERVKGAHNPKDAAMQFVEAAKDLFIRRSDDTLLGEKTVLTGFNNKRVETLPKYYKWINSDESIEDVSEDVASTLLAYASMACDYAEMNKIIDVLEVGRDLAADREIKVRSGGKGLYEQYGAFKKQLAKKGGENSLFMGRLNDYFSMQIYGHFHEDEGTFGKTKIDKGKTADFINRLTALGMYALNLLGGIGNVATGRAMMRVEAAAGRYINYSDLVKGDIEYFKSLPAFLAEVGSRIKTSKLALFDEKFNVMQEYEQNIREVNYDRKTWFSRMFGDSALYFMNNMGEHYMQNRTAFALAKHYKLLDTKTGKQISLWDALEVRPGDIGKKGGAKLVIKEGVKKLDGSDFTDEDVIQFSLKSASINQSLHGIYNQADRNALQAKGLGRMAMMFRKWIVPSLNKRYKGARYNYDTQDMEEGYYRTAGRFIVQLMKEIKETQFNIIAAWKNTTESLEDYEIANIKRAIAEVAQFATICGAIGIMDWQDDDDTDKPYYATMIEYQLRRLRTEIGVLVPSVALPREALRIAQSPAAGINELEALLGLVNVINPYKWEVVGGEDAIIKLGRYKGRSKGYRALMEAIPMNKTLYRGIHPENAIPFYKQ